LLRILLNNERALSVSSSTVRAAMYVCVCKAVTEGNIRAAMQAGCHTLAQLKRELGVASECGRCAGCANQMLGECRRHNHHHHHKHSEPAALATA
jgi:bacterioferritin-associated ferredoxin